MDRTTKIEIKQIYDNWFHAYVNGDVEAYGSYFETEYPFSSSTGNLNFVNNFAEVSLEMLEEATEEIDTVKAYNVRPIPDGATDQMLAILNDIKSDLEKTHDHGKRADAIAKGLPPDSRSSTDVKESNEINTLFDKYLRLSYHGLLGKDKSFNAALNNDLDFSIRNTNVVPQDAEREILNLLTSAFYTCNERKKIIGTLQYSRNNGNLDFEPTVSISTKKTGNSIEIKVVDNSNGIPKKVLDKIFHPFITSKLNGVGKELGLLLSYDIVKSQSGELLAETQVRTGTSSEIAPLIT